jgi:hypothetical protein
LTFFESMVKIIHPYAPHLILKTIMTIKHWYSILRIIHDLLPVVKLFPEGTNSDTNCWITERGDESVIEKFNPF